MTDQINPSIAAMLGVRESQVAAAVGLLDDGATVPFIARYRKEATGGLDDTQLRNLEERLRYLRELAQRRSAILGSIFEQGKLTPELEQSIRNAQTKVELEDLYLPYKQKRRTRAQIAREAGLEPLADSLLQNSELDPEQAAADFVRPDSGVPDVKAALEGARFILVEKFAEDGELLGQLRELLWREGLLRSTLVAGKAEVGAKFSDYFDYREPIRLIPSHRALAVLRGRNEQVLSIEVILPDDDLPAPSSVHRCEGVIARHFSIFDHGRRADRWLLETVRLAWRAKIHVHLELELINQVREAAEKEAIGVFARNLHDLLLAAPAGEKAAIGLDPGLRTGVKVAVVDATGRVLETTTIYPHVPRNEWDRSIAELARLAQNYSVKLISIGNGTASRETDRLAAELIARHPALGLQKVVVSEAGASVYSASEFAAAEFPDLDVSLRGAVSIARRLQDPLAELVKIDPKSIGVGQYQHDVNQAELARALDSTVEDCVNAVGVDLNTASEPLLGRVSGLSRAQARNIVEYRNQHGPFKARAELVSVPRLGAKAFEQAAGFLRVRGGSNPLDQSGVHPEAYPVVARILADTGREIGRLIGDCALLKSLDARRYTCEQFGLPTVNDILRELEKPGRDPRPEFRAAVFREGVERIKDLVPGMLLEGVVTNVTNFGAFVDVGVHQDGLVHISMLAERFVKDPHSVVKAGDLVKVKVLEVDEKRHRIALSMRLSDEPGKADRAGGHLRPAKVARPGRQPEGAMAMALAKLRR